MSHRKTDLGIPSRYTRPNPSTQPSGWHGEYQSRLNCSRIVGQSFKAQDEAAAKFTALLRRHHPELGGMVGIADCGRLNLVGDQSYILRNAMSTLWKRHGTFQPGAEAIEAIIDEFAEFVDQTRVRVRYTAPVLNYTMAAERIEFSDGVCLRRLTEQEINEIYGGSVWQLGMMSMFRRGLMIDEYAVEGECDAQKMYGDAPADVFIRDTIGRRLDSIMLALRTFKDGRVGYDSIRLQPVKFCPLPFGSLGFGDLHVPFGRYALSEVETEPLRGYTELISACSEPVMKMACSRLADAQTRLRPQDQLIDAVIGLEALLLAGMSKEDRRGELRFRFSLNYAMLAATPEERQQAFRVAGDLYDLRSAIAHGGEPGESGICKIGGERVSLPDAARLGMSVLRGVVHRFLPEAHSAPYRRDQYWKQAYFGERPEMVIESRERGDQFDKSNEGKCCDAIIRLLEDRTGFTRNAVRLNEKAAGSSKDVEVRLALGDRDYAIEHTKIMGFEDVAQHRNFVELRERVKTEALAVPGNYILQVGIVPKNVHKDQERLQALIAWAHKAAMELYHLSQNEANRGRRVEKVSAPWGDEFEVKLVRESWSLPDVGMLDVRQYGSRYKSDDLSQKLTKALKDKCDKLKAHKDTGARSILALEMVGSNISHHSVCELLPDILGSRADLPDEIFLIDSLTSKWFILPIKQGEEYPEHPGLMATEIDSQELSDINPSR